MKKKLTILMLLAISFLIVKANAPIDGIEPVFWGWSYGSPSETKNEGGTGNCFQEAQARHYIMWIGGSVQTRYRYVDCGSGAVLGDWSPSLLGIE